eukprot:708794-Prorocentrum_minimum.AAC.3
MLDINLFRVEKGGNPDIVRESQRRRYAPVEAVDKVIELDTAWRNARYELDTLNRDFNKINKDVAKKKIAKEDASAEITQCGEIQAQIKVAEVAEKEAEAACMAELNKIGNLVHDSVPLHDDEDNNKIEKLFGTPRQAKEGEKLYNHVDLVKMLDIVELEKGQEVAGGRGYYLKGEGMLLNMALINSAVGFLMTKGFTPVQTPFFMKKDCMAECAQLEQFDEELYKVSGEGDDKYLIATSEQTLCAMMRRTWQQEKDLPKRFAGYSTCFRKEAGSHGRDTLGIFRVHQFEKVEQFVITTCEGDDSWKEQEEMLANSEAFYQKLELPYRVVNIVSGALNNAAAKKYDLEAHFPASSTFRELVSCSNCTDYQSRHLEVRQGQAKKGPEGAKQYVHLLNSTLTATERTLCCVLENHQTPDGVNIPEFLQPYMHGIKFIPFRKVFDKKGLLVSKAELEEKAAAEAAKKAAKAAAKAAAAGVENMAV